MSKESTLEPAPPLWARARTGDALTIAAALAFYALCAMIPLVGKAAVATAWYRENVRSFLGVLFAALALALLATGSKFARRAREGGRRPWISIGLAAGCLAILACFAAGLLGI